jgi:hypothetical protein
MFDMGMDPTFANTGGWGVPQETVSLPAIAGTVGSLVPAGKVVASLPSTVSKLGKAYETLGGGGTRPIKDLIETLPIAPGYGTKTPWSEIIGRTIGGSSPTVGATHLPVTWALPIASGIGYGAYDALSGDDPVDYEETVQDWGDPTIMSPIASPDITAQATQAMAAERSAAQLAQAAQSAGVDVSSIDPAVAAPGGYVNLDALAGQVTAAQEELAVAAEQARQEEADAKAAEYMAAAADTQDIMMAGGTLGGGTAPLPAVSAPMAPRQQAMPAAVNARLAQEASARQQQQAQQDMVRQANKIMRSRDYMDAGIGGLTGAQLDVLAAANIDTFAGAGRQEGGFDARGGYSASGMGQQGGSGHPGMR